MVDLILILVISASCGASCVYAGYRWGYRNRYADLLRSPSGHYEIRVYKDPAGNIMDGRTGDMLLKAS